MKWFFLLVLVAVVAFATGLRVDLKVLSDKFLKKHDRNVETMLKLGIDPSKIDYRGKPWWTFKAEDSVLAKLRPQDWDPTKPITALLQISGELKKKLGPGAGEIVESQAREALVQARLAQQNAETRIREVLEKQTRALGK